MTAIEVENEIRAFVHRIVDRTDFPKLRAIVELLGEEYFSAEEIAEIKELQNSDDWTDWEDIRRDV